MTSSGCLVCKCETLEPHLEILRRCPTCGFVTAQTEAPVDAPSLYGDGYFRGEEYLDYPSDEAFFKRQFRRRLHEILGRTSRGRLLEIGAAYGFFLDLARDQFQVVGYEVNEAAARYAREQLGLDVRAAEFLGASIEDVAGPIDVTVMWDVIEHLERPDLYVARIAEVSRPGALLYVTTGDIGSFVARWRGRRWRMIHPPTHLHYFSRPTLARLLSAHGFRVLDVKTVGVARSVRQVLYSILVLRMGRARLYQLSTRFVPATWGFSINTFDIMQMVAERTG